MFPKLFVFFPMFPQEETFLYFNLNVVTPYKESGLFKSGAELLDFLFCWLGLYGKTIRHHICFESLYFLGEFCLGWEWMM